MSAFTSADVVTTVLVTAFVVLVWVLHRDATEGYSTSPPYVEPGGGNGFFRDIYRGEYPVLPGDDSWTHGIMARQPECVEPDVFQAGCQRRRSAFARNLPLVDAELDQKI